MSFNDRGKVEAFLNFANAGMGYFSALEMEKKAATGGAGAKVPKVVARARKWLQQGEEATAAAGKVVGKAGEAPTVVRSVDTASQATTAADLVKKGPGFLRGTFNFFARPAYYATFGLLPSTVHDAANGVRGVAHFLSADRTNLFRRGADSLRTIAKAADDYVPNHAFTTGNKNLDHGLKVFGQAVGYGAGPAVVGSVIGEDSPAVDSYYRTTYSILNNATPAGLLFSKVILPKLQEVNGMNKEGGWWDDYVVQPADKYIVQPATRAWNYLTDKGGKAIEKGKEKVNNVIQGAKMEAAAGIGNLVQSWMKDGELDPKLIQAWIKANPGKAQIYWPIITNMISIGAVGTSAATINSLYKQGWMPNYLMKQYIAPFIVQQTVDGIVKRYKAYYPEYYAADPNREKELRATLTQQIQKQGEEGIDLTNADKLDTGTLALGLGLAGLVGGGAMMLFGGGGQGGNGGGNEMAANGRSGGGVPEWIRKAQENARNLMQTQQGNTAMATNSYPPTRGTTFVGPGGRESTFLGTWQNNVNTALGQNSLDASYRTLANPGRNITNEYLDRSAQRAIGGGGNTATA